MGYITTGTTISLNARLTPTGRQLLINNSIGSITKFALGDSDANYGTSGVLGNGEIPTQSGDVGLSGSTNNSTYSNLSIRSYLMKDNIGTIFKSIESSSSTLNVFQSFLGTTVVTGSTDLSQSIIDRTDTSAVSTNLFYSFGLPITSTDLAKYSSLTSTYGGYADTGISGISQNRAIVIAIKNSSFGEVIDGKTIKISLTTTAATYTIYGTYRADLKASSAQDVLLTETASDFSNINSNICFLFSDTIQKPNNDSGKSWATQWNQYKPFTNGKSLFNYKTNTGLSKVADIPVGIAYLDKGFVVITHPTIVNNFSTVTGPSATTVTFNSAITNIQQNITCISSRGEFGYSSNPTFSSGDIPRISELGLFDAEGNLIALAKTDRHIETSANSFVAFNVLIKL